MSEAYIRHSLKLNGSTIGLTVGRLREFLGEAVRHGATDSSTVRWSTQAFGTLRVEVDLPLSDEATAEPPQEPRPTVSSLQVERAAEVLSTRQGTVTSETLALMVVEALGLEVHG